MPRFQRCERSRITVLPLVLLTGLLSTLGCGRSSPDDATVWTVDERLISDLSQLPLGDDLRPASEEVLRWDLFAPEAIRDWTAEGADRMFEADGRALSLASNRRYLRLTRRTEFQADDIDLVRLNLDKVPFGGQFWLRWAGPDEKFSDDRSIHIPPFSGPVPKVIHFDVSTHPLWTGQVRRVRIGLGAGQGQTFRLVSLQGLVYSEGATQDADPKSAQLVTLDHEVRGAVLATSDAPLRWTVKVPENARLRFGYGLGRRASVTSELAVVAAVQGQEPVTLFSRPALPALVNRWSDHTVDLSAFAGKQVEIRFGITASDAESPQSRAEVLWSNPEILEGATLAPANLVLVVVDTLRADRLSLYGNPSVTSPELDDWASRQGIVFETTVAAAPWTLPSHVSLFSGLDAHRHGVNYDSPAPASIPMLAEILRVAGFTTLGVTGGGYLHPRFGFHRGFDLYRSWPSQATEDERTHLESSMDIALDLIDENQQRPFFLFFHTYEVHEPYTPRQPFFTELGGPDDPPEVRLDHHREIGVDEGFIGRRRLGVLTDEDPPSWTPLPEALADLPYDLYDSSIAFADQQLGRLWRRLQELDTDRPTMVIFTSDHGEMLGEHDLAGHAALYDETLLVPLVIRLPEGQHAALRIRESVRSIDIMPTILEVLGVPLPEGLDGRSLMPLIDGSRATDQSDRQIAWSYASKPNLGAALRTADDLKLMLNHTVWAPSRGEIRLYQVSNDPSESRDLAEERSTEAAALVQHAKETLARELPGLRIRLQNPGSIPISGEISGEPVEAARVKSLDLPCACVEWRNAHSIGFEVPAGATFTLILESATPQPLTLRFEQPDSPDLQLDLRELAGIRSLTHSAQGWEWSSVPDAANSAVASLWWQRDPMQEQPQMDAELREQLEALGYIH